MTFEEILKDTELKLLRHFEFIRNDLIKSTEKQTIKRVIEMFEEIYVINEGDHEAICYDFPKSIRKRFEVKDDV
jgi:hypothetical protein